MKIRFLIELRVLILAVAFSLLTSGCWSAHPHSAFRAIHQFAINGDAAGVAAELAQDSSELNLPEDHALTALHLAAQNCHSNVVVLLLDRGANIDAKADDQATPLHLAAQEGCTEVVVVLLARSAKINLRDNQQRTPLGRARQWQQDAVVQLLQQHGGTD